MKGFAVVVALTALSAWADVPPPDLAGCADKKVGDACKRDDGSSATCAKATCSRNDYSNGPPPTSVNYECVTCTGPKSGCAVAPGGVAFAMLGLGLLRRRRA